MIELNKEITAYLDYCRYQKKLSKDTYVGSHAHKKNENEYSSQADPMLNTN